jgi:Fe-S-cluster containining protein
VVEVPSEPCQPGDIVPALHKIADAVVATSAQSASCGPGCGACCRQLVPLTLPEIAFFQDLVSGLSLRQRQRILQQAGESMALLWKGDLGSPTEMWRKSKSELRSIALRWFENSVPCPFLVDESCSIYQDRPLICREYLVSSPPA